MRTLASLRFVFLIGALALSGCQSVFTRTASPQPDRPWKNSLGMKFVPVPGTAVLFSIWDVRVQDYQAFAQATGRPWTKPDFPQGPTHPAVNVTWFDAADFCAWLTAKERAAGRLTANQGYRLPTDSEWSIAAGLVEPPLPWLDPDFFGVLFYPEVLGVFPWGTQWPPPKGAANVSPELKADDFLNTSPVGSFPANKYGLFDMGGNVTQWCLDLYTGIADARVVRGADFETVHEHEFLSSRRGNTKPNFKDYASGFRCVLYFTPQ